MKTIITSITITLFLIFSNVSFANNSTIETALLNFDKAASGDESVVELAYFQFHNLVKQDPQQPFYKARLGSLITMQARDAWAPWKKMSFTEQGLDHIDIALDKLNKGHEKQTIADLNVSIDVRYTAAITFTNLPKFFNRWGQAERILKKLTQAELIKQTAPAFQVQIWMTRARLAKQREKMALYKTYLQKVLALDASSTAAAEAKTLLEEIEL